MTPEACEMQLKCPEKAGEMLLCVVVNVGVVVLTEEEEEASERRMELSCWSPPPDHTERN